MNSLGVFSSTVLAVVLLHTAAVALNALPKGTSEEFYTNSDYYLTSCATACTPGGRECKGGCSCVFFGNDKNGTCYKVNETDITDWDSLPKDLPGSDWATPIPARKATK